MKATYKKNEMKFQILPTTEIYDLVINLVANEQDFMRTL